LGICALSLLACISAFAASLEVKITPKFSGEAIQPASLRYQTASDETFSITRVSFLASDFALQRMDGSWFEITNSVGWFDLEQNRTSAHFDNLPSGKFRSMRFLIGLNTNLNHADVARFAADHPLNPNLNGLHWSWQGGFIFAALEGLWRNSAGELDGWAYHLARDTNSVQVIVSAALDTSNEAAVEIDFDLATLLGAPRPLSFAKDGSSTHSRDGDPIAAQLKANLAGTFRVQRISAWSDSGVATTTAKPLYLPAKFTPYRFQMSATFPIPDLPKDNPLIEERVALGKVLFNETALSKDNSLSCASCHKQNAAFSDPRRFSAGVRDQLGNRNAMPLFNLAWKRSFFWDGRAPTLRAQSLMPVQDHREMDESLTNVVAKLSAIRREADVIKGANTMDYAALFAAAFGSPEITPEKISLALEQFLLTLTSFDSRFDRAARGEEKLSAQEQRGLKLFMTEYDPRREQYGADCFHCHGGPLFQSQSFANNGLDSEFADPGRAKVTGKASDQGKFATPSLRNVALTAPYMHDGRFQSLEEVVNHYSSGVKRSATLDPNLAKHPDTGIQLSAEDQSALVAFLRTLTDEKFQRVIR
jgi:cytochrome c peroxidase